jgi:DNA helicase II / ATP-dependent DNA helicase PcrA
MTGTVRVKKGVWCPDDADDLQDRILRAPAPDPTDAIPELLGEPGQRMEGIFGPPGTGKTSCLVDTVKAERAGQTSWDQIAFIAYTKAAADEAANRVCSAFDVTPKELPHFRTLHSLCWGLLHHRGTVLTDARLREFATCYGYRMSGTTLRGSSDVIDQLGRGAAEDDALLAVHEWSRARRIPLEEAHRRFPFQVPFERLRRFAERYGTFRADNGLVDFSDMLEHTVYTRLQLPVTAAIVDEAQDLTPLQAAVVEQLFQNCDRVYVAGDDDQCIYTWAGADPAWMLSLRRRCTSTRVLPQSFRVPAAVHTVAQRIIRLNSNRVPKRYLPRAGA